MTEWQFLVVVVQLFVVIGIPGLLYLLARLLGIDVNANS